MAPAADRSAGGREEGGSLLSTGFWEKDPASAFPQLETYPDGGAPFFRTGSPIPINK